VGEGEGGEKANELIVWFREDRMIIDACPVDLHSSEGKEKER
jgi:hypothetical protein